MKQELPVGLANLLAKPSFKIKTTRKAGRKYPFYPPSELLPGECEVSVPDENGNYTTRLIRYVPGMKSIFVDEWSDKERELKPKKIKLINGHYTVPTSDRNLVNFLYYSGHNKANKETRLPSHSELFEILDFEQRSKDAVDARRTQIEAEYFVSTAPIEDVRAMALALCKSKDEADSLMKEGEFIVRHKMQAVAIKTPDMFVKTRQSKNLKNKIAVYKALQEGIIHLSVNNDSLSWYAGEEFAKCQMGTNVVDWFSDLSEKRNDYKEAMEEIYKAIKAKRVEQEDAKPWDEQILEQAIESKNVEVSGNWYVIADKEGEEPAFKFNSKNKILNSIKTNEKGILSYLVK